MDSFKTLKDTIFNITHHAQFEQVALQVFNRQAQENLVYKSYLAALGVKPETIDEVERIPFLPISFFKQAHVVTGNFTPQQIFTSSGTTGQTPSRHFVADLNMYQTSFLTTFTKFYGPPENLTILALLPSYLERTGSSLVQMADVLIKKSEQPASGFYLHNLSELVGVLQGLSAQNKPTLLLGVSFALLDLAEFMPENFKCKNLMVMETGGMKGRRKEMIREELHQILIDTFSVAQIHSEYGMTELLSQAYSTGDGIFYTPPWMRAYVRDTTDPLSLVANGKTGGVNIIDLANLHSCAFLATEDLGRKYADETFQILGRFDEAEIRGCNLMME